MASVAIEVLVSFASLSCIVLCVVLKLPQIAAIWSSKSAKGVSLQSTLLEWFCYAVMMCYHFVNEYPLSTYAEYLFLNIQDLALVLIILYFQDRLGLEALLYITGYFIIVSVLSTSLAVAKIMINFVLPMSMASKLIQLRALWTSRDASSVSPTTWFIAFYSCVARIFTTIVETGDIPVLLTQSVSGVLNCSIGLSVVYLQAQKTSAKREKRA
ncbi:PREDICTED: PQ-loop repeat-containing protein 3-like isoform X2 [Branchiostoma belcheri]|uniref:PQ-loop repeat-containing protein 3-like isoform X2 n=1 Tax=Branchiostoma belcheri TaxID=7741 RepID=A0A6P4Z9J8_BRABE|nr:PREDICTED: PQ-loop repeat-containing protein 3-like isoform X2 [Branchiostoma belcheri]